MAEKGKENVNVNRGYVNRGLLSILGIMIFILVIILAIYFINYSSQENKSLTGNAINALADKKNCRDVQVPYEEQETYFESVPYTDKECESKVLVYNRGDFNLVSSVCNQKLEECHKSYPIIGCTDKTIYCTDRTITCSLGINNLDDERGNWNADFSFFKSGTSNIEATNSPSLWLDPHSSGVLTGQGRITTKELYDSQYSCNYIIKDEPTKQVCRDVIKYQDVQRTRTITKYKTETQCN